MIDQQVEHRKVRVAKAFSAAASYDEHAHVQRRAAERLADRIAQLDLPADARVCEIGCGTGFLGQALGARLPDVAWLATDICPEMLDRAKARLAGDSRFDFALADAEAPEALRSSGPFDLICSNFAAQWFSDLPLVLARLTRLLRPGGFLLLTTLAEGTFREWRQAHQQAGFVAGTPKYPTIHDLRAMRPDGLGVAVTYDILAEVFDAPHGFLEAVRGIGAQTPTEGHAPLTAGQMRRVLRNFSAAGCRVTYVVATCSLRREPYYKAVSASRKDCRTQAQLLEPDPQSTTAR